MESSKVNKYISMIKKRESFVCGDCRWAVFFDEHIRCSYNVFPHYWENHEKGKGGCFRNLPQTKVDIPACHHFKFPK